MLIGNVGKDPEVRYLEGNAAKVATFTLATTERYRDRNGESRENTEWHNIVAWRNTADIVEKFVKKGTALYIEGKIRTREYTDQTGMKKYRTEINVDSLQLLGRRDDNAGAPSFQQPSYQQNQPAAAPVQAPVQQASPASQASGPINIDLPEDDLPF